MRRRDPVQELAGLQVVPTRRFDNFLDARGVRERSIFERLTTLVPMQDHEVLTASQIDLLLMNKSFHPLDDGVPVRH
jgi:hypothetical protein